MIKKDPANIIQQALNSPIWQAKKGVGTFLTFDMGERLISKKRNGTIFHSGSIHLWIYLCDWKIKKSSGIIVESNANDDKITAALGLFNNEKMISMRKVVDNSIEIEFSGEILLILEGNSGIYDKNDDFFILYTPFGNVSYNKESGFEIEEKSSA